MLIEFTGPSASGKTEFVRHLLSTWPESRSVRRSVSLNALPVGPKLRAALSYAHEAPQAFLNAYKWHRRGFGLSSNPVRASLRMAVEYSLLKGLSQDSRLWLLDQGRLQLGSWLDSKISKHPCPYADVFNDFIAIGNAVFFISMAPSLAVERLYQRGDGEKGEYLAKKRGYTSYLALIEAYVESIPEKISLSTMLGSPVMHFNVSEDGRLNGPWVYEPPDGADRKEVILKLQEIANCFWDWWE